MLWSLKDPHKHDSALTIQNIRKTTSKGQGKEHNYFSVNNTSLSQKYNMLPLNKKKNENRQKQTFQQNSSKILWPSSHETVYPSIGKIKEASNSAFDNYDY